MIFDPSNRSKESYPQHTGYRCATYSVLHSYTCCMYRYDLHAKNPELEVSYSMPIQEIISWFSILRIYLIRSKEKFDSEFFFSKQTIFFDTSHCISNFLEKPSNFYFIYIYEWIKRFKILPFLTIIITKHYTSYRSETRIWKFANQREGGAFTFKYWKNQMIS